MRDGQTLTRASARRCAGTSASGAASALPVYRDANEREPPDTAMLSLVVDDDAYIKMFLQREGFESLEVEAGTAREIVTMVGGGDLVPVVRKLVASIAKAA